MKLATLLSLIIILLGLGIFQDLQAQTTLGRYDVQFVAESNSGTFLDVKVQIRSGGADFQLFNANLVFTYSPTANFGKPVLLKRFENFDNTVSSHYKAMTMTYPLSGRLSLNIGQNEPPYTTVSSSWMDVAVVRLPITDASGAYNLSWNYPSATNSSSGGQTVVYQYTGTTARPAIIGAGSTTGLNGSLGQINLLAFIARLSGKQVMLTWTTSADSRIQNFDIERSAQSSRWEKIGTVEGSSRTQNYSYSDKDIAGAAELYYRLKMTDEAGQAKYSSIAKVQFANVSVRPQLLASFPNPFNPMVTIHFTIPSDQAVTVTVYDAAGKEVVRLFDNEFLQQGDYTKVLNGADLASGKYLLRLVAGDYVASENLILNK